LIENKTSGQMETVIKCRGINLTSSFNKDTIPYSEIKYRMLQYMKKIILPQRKILQLKKKPTKIDTNMALTLVEVSLQKEIKSRRKILSNTATYKSVPFGFCVEEK